MTNKSKSNKALKIGIPIAAVVLLIGISLAVMLGSSTRVAFLNVEEGAVEVDTGNGWVPATDGMKLSEDDSVRTLEGKAVLILYESIIINLDENTEVTIADLSKDNVKVKQGSGSTWNKFANIMGIKGFEVETPTTVATVRGTEFWVDMDSVGVSDGEVDVKMAGAQFTVKPGHKVIKPAGVAKLVNFTELDKKEIIANKKVVINQLKDLRQQEIEKHKTTYELAKKIKGWTDADVQRYINRLDNGEFNVEELKEKTILPAESIDKFAKLTKEIQEYNKEMPGLNTGAGSADMDTRMLGGESKDKDKGGLIDVTVQEGESTDDDHQNWIEVRSMEGESQDKDKGGLIETSGEAVDINRVVQKRDENQVLTQNTEEKQAQANNSIIDNTK